MICIAMVVKMPMKISHMQGQHIQIQPTSMFCMGVGRQSTMAALQLRKLRCGSLIRRSSGAGFNGAQILDITGQNILYPVTKQSFTFPYV
jgi:hypothetical protein